MNNQLNNDQDGKRPDNKDPRQGSGKNHQSILAFLICLLVTLVCFALFTNMLKDNSSEISYDKFIAVSYTHLDVYKRQQLRRLYGLHGH